MTKLGSAIFSRLVILIPYAWLLFFFLIPFFIVFRISLSTTAIAQPPYEPVFSLADGLSGLVVDFGLPARSMVIFRAVASAWKSPSNLPR